jgi:hypothetical protein
MGRPLCGHRLEQDELEREPFTAELKTLLASPVFTKGERPKGGKGDAAFWLPLLGLFTGARRGELVCHLACVMELNLSFQRRGQRRVVRSPSVANLRY